jgi:hypothetical protein
LCLIRRRRGKEGIISSRIANDIQELLVRHHQIREGAEFLASPLKEKWPMIAHFPIIQKFNVVSPSKPDLLPFFYNFFLRNQIPMM